jgi:hypothetical protein
MTLRIRFHSNPLRVKTLAFNLKIAVHFEEVFLGEFVFHGV